MAKVVQDQPSVVKPWWAQLNTLYVGAGLGLVWWAVAAILRRYVIEPIACQNLSSASVCSDSFSVAGSIAAIIIAVLGAYVLVRLWQPRPIVIAAASAVLLWDLATLVSGLVWWEVALWAVGLYALSYWLFSFIVRFRKTVTAIVVAAAVVIIIRLFLFFG